MASNLATRQTSGKGGRVVVVGLIVLDNVLVAIVVVVEVVLVGATG